MTGYDPAIRDEHGFWLNVTRGIASIPKENGDIRRTLKRRFLRDSVICAAWCTVVIVLSYIFGYFSDIGDAIMTGNFRKSLLAVLLLAACALPFLKLRFWRWFSDRTFEGDIVEIRFNERLEPRNPTIGARGGLLWVHRQYITLRMTDGKIKKIRLKRREGERTPTYQRGERIRHYYGTDLRYMQKLSAKDDIFPDKGKIQNICVMCGATNEANDEYCDFCGSSIPDRTK